MIAVGDVGDWHQVRLWSAFDHDGADARDPNQMTFFGQFAQCPADGHTRHVQLLHQTVL
jgi:hypothetical protein